MVPELQPRPVPLCNVRLSDGTPIHQPQPLTLMDVVAAEQAQIQAGAAGCGFTCQCHGGYVCVRRPHPDEEDNRVPHVGLMPDGTPVQWTGPHTDTVMAAAAAPQDDPPDPELDGIPDATRTLLATIDPDVLRTYVASLDVET